MSHRISSNKDNVFVPGAGMLDSGEEGIVSDAIYAALTAAGRFADGLLTYIEDVTEPGEGTTLTSYGQISALPNYPTTFPADFSGLTPEVIGAQPAGNYQPAGDYAAAGHNHDGSYATAAQGAKADSALQPGDLPWTPTEPDWNALVARVEALETPPVE